MNPFKRLEQVRDETSYFAEKDGPFYGKLHLFEGHPDSKVAIILGENGAGKSFLRKMVHALCREDKEELIHLSMAGRCASDGMGIMRLMIYGTESDRSTGANSAGVVETAFKTVEARAKDGKEATNLFFDEPDTGLSDHLAAGVGKYIVEKTAAAPDVLKSAFIVTHRRCLVRHACVFDRGLMPHVAVLGPKPKLADNAQRVIKDWLDETIIPISPEDIDDITTWRAVEAFRKKIMGERA